MKVIELFAGVGGFRLGLTAANRNAFEIVWSNQFEPSTKKQYASEIYVRSFGPENHSNQDINEVIKHNFEQIPDHDLLQPLQVLVFEGIYVQGFLFEKGQELQQVRTHDHGICSFTELATDVSQRSYHRSSLIRDGWNMAGRMEGFRDACFGDRPFTLCLLFA